MGNITTRIHNLVAGVSQQPNVLRRPEQLETQINGLSTEAAGVQKRPPTLHIKNLYEYDGEKVQVYFINRDEVEQYVVLICAKFIRVFDLNGKEYTVNNKAQDYLKNVTAPISQLKLQTIADYTFVVNKTCVTKMSAATDTDTMVSQGCLIHVKQGMYGRIYKIFIDGTEQAKFEPPDGGDASHIKKITTTYIKDQLVTELQKNTRYTITSGSSWLRIRTNDNVQHTYGTDDGYNNASMKAILGSISDYSDLPAQAPNGYIVKITGSNNANDEYYVKYSTTTMRWEETVRSGLKNTIDKTTMPCALVRQADGTFTFDYCNWAKRESGDTESNEQPSFIGHKINEVFFYRNRLGFLSADNVIFSDSTDLFNFWFKSAYTIQDTDVIDTTVSSNQIVNLHHAIPMSSDLFLFSDDEQFILSTDAVLSPKNCPIGASTVVQNSPDVRPVGVGNSIYFVSNRAKYASLTEYKQSDAYSYEKIVEDVTSYIPSYIPNYPYKIVSNTNEHILGLLTSNDRKSIYIYKYLYLGYQRVQQSWSRWEFDGDVLGAEFIDNSLYLVIERETGVALEKITIQSATIDIADEPYRVMLDRKRDVLLTSENSNWNEITGEMTLDLGGIIGDENTQAGVVLYNGKYYNGKGTIVLKDTGDLTDKKVIVGVPYHFEIAMSQLAIKSMSAQTNMIDDVPVYRLIIQKVWFNYADSGYFEVIVNNQYRYKMTSHIIGATVLSGSKLTTGTIKVPVRKPNDKLAIKVQSDLPLPVALVGAGWEGLYTTRHKRV